MRDDFLLFCGTANRSLGPRVAHLLDRTPAACLIERFPDGEVHIRFDEPVRGRDVYILQSTCPPVDKHLIELLAIADACRRASARSITAVVPYFGYARADKRNGQRTPVTGSMVARMIEAVGINHLLTVDLHAAQIEGFFQIPVDILTAIPSLCYALESKLPAQTVVVSPDEGGVKMATQFARRLHAPLALLHKERRSGSETRVTHVVGDIQEKPCLIVDDMISTGGTIADAVNALVNAGAQPKIRVAVTHGLFTGNARERLAPGAIQDLVITDSVPNAQRFWPELTVVSLAPMLAGAIHRYQCDESLADLFEQVIPNGTDRLTVGETDEVFDQGE